MHESNMHFTMNIFNIVKMNSYSVDGIMWDTGIVWEICNMETLSIKLLTLEKTGGYSEKSHMNITQNWSA